MIKTAAGKMLERDENDFLSDADFALARLRSLNLQVAHEPRRSTEP